MDLISYAMGKQASGGGSQPTGTIEITSNGTYNVSNYASANVNVESLNINDYFGSQVPSNTSYGYSIIKKIPSIDYSAGTNISYSFSSWDSLEEVVEIKNTENCQKFNDMFAYCKKLKKVPIFSWASATNIDRMFNGCNDLTDESLNNIMYMCAHCNPSVSSVKKLSNLGIQSGQRTRCQSLSNYQALLDAGWTLE
jgi:hypothetical protein